VDQQKMLMAEKSIHADLTLIGFAEPINLTPC
jgi:hypothetical protein